MAKLQVVEMKPMMILPPRPELCQLCAGNHDPRLPHDADSLYYQMSFRLHADRWPTWLDAMAHCDQQTRDFWAEELDKRGIKIGPQSHNFGNPENFVTLEA